MRALFWKPTPASAARTGLRAYALLLACALPIGGLASAQVPKAGDYYEDRFDIGFRVRTPKGWEFTPPNPEQNELLATFWGDSGNQVFIDPETHMRIRCALVAFDRRGTRQARREDQSARDLARWVDENLLYAGRWHACRVEPISLRGFEGAKEVDFELRPDGDGEPLIRAYAVIYPFSEDLDLAWIGTGPGDKRWSKYRRSYAGIARTMRREAIALAPIAPLDNTPRSLRRAELQNQIRRLPGWSLHETPNYLILTSVDDGGFIEEVRERLEAIRGIFETDFSPETAERYRQSARDPDDPAAGELSYEQRLARSRACVVRVCKNRAEYTQYGGWERSAGRFSPEHEELVLFDDQERGGRRHTWSALNHEAFHQYFHCLYGPIEGSPWFDEGVADFYGGFEYRAGRFRPRPLAEREGIARSLLREGRFVPLSKLVRMTQIQYYGYSAHDTGPGDHYAQGWSLIYFLRHGGGGRRPKGWDDSWDLILDTYLAELVRTRKSDWAVHAAFSGVDWEAFETAWKNYTL